MPLVPMKELLADAQSSGYALCYCEAWNLESGQAVLQAAEEVGSPTIIGFNGGSLVHPPRAAPESLAYYAGMAGLAIRQATVPVALLLNETDSLSQIRDAIEMGFNAVMLDEEHLDGDEYRELVKKVVLMAHARNVWVEAQVGRLPAGDESDGGKAWTADPTLARRFVEETRVDALSVAIGNVHILTTNKASLDLDLLKRIHAEVEVPLVLHGGTGIPIELAPEVIAQGVAKVNYGTVLKQAYLAAIRQMLKEYKEPMNPHPFLGWGGQQDIMVAGREAVKCKVKELLNVYGSAGRAALYWENNEF